MGGYVDVVGQENGPVERLGVTILATNAAAIKCAAMAASLERVVQSRVIQGDSRKLLDLGLAKGSLDCIVTSPPYWNLKRYGEEVGGELGHGQTLDEYFADLGRVFAACHELASSNGVMWVVVDTMRYPTRTPREYELLPLPTQLADIARDVGWRFHDLVVWRKNKTLPYSGAGKLRNLVEYVLFLTKTREFKHRPHRVTERHQPGAKWLAGWPERYHPLGRNPANIWDIDIPTQGMWAHSERLHFCPLPPELVRRCIDLTSDPGDVVFDPFAGIGTVPAQAEAMGRVGVGVELNSSFIEIFEAKTRQELLAEWERGARGRGLARKDQAAEAALILRLRALKAGKELMRYLERLAQGRPSHHPASHAQAVIVCPTVEPEAELDVLAGKCPPLKVSLLVVSDCDAEARGQLRVLLAEALESANIRALGLDLVTDLVDPSVADAEHYLTGWPAGETRTLYEFDLSRHGAFTQRPLQNLFPSLPRLLTTIDLGPPVHPSTLSPLDQARAEGEKKLLQSLLTSGVPVDVMAQQLRIARVELDKLLERHGLASSVSAFAVALPDDLLERAERVIV
jgi:DNA modification methylase